MSMATGYVPHGILLPSAAFVSQLDDLTPQTNIDELVGLAAGHPQPLFAANMHSAPDIMFSSPMLKTVLDAAGLFGLDCSGGNTDVFFKKAADLGSRVVAATTEHLRMRATQAFFYWMAIEAEQQQTAKIFGRLALTYDGTNAPLVPAGSVALSGTSTGVEFFTLGPIKINSGFIPGVKKVRVDLGYQTHEESSDGDEFRTFFCAKELNPVVVTITTINATDWTDYGVYGTGIAALSVFFKRLVNLAGHWGAASAQHVKLTNVAAMVLPQKSGSRGNELVSPELRLLLTAADAASNVLTINTASAIS